MPLGSCDSTHRTQPRPNVATQTHRGAGGAAAAVTGRDGLCFLTFVPRAGTAASGRQRPLPAEPRLERRSQSRSLDSPTSVADARGRSRTRWPRPGLGSCPRESGLHVSAQSLPTARIFHRPRISFRSETVVPEWKRCVCHGHQPLLLPPSLSSCSSHSPGCIRSADRALG